MNRRALLQTIGATVLGVTVAGCTDQGTGETDDVPAGAQGDVVEENLHENLRIVESELFRGAEGFGVLGTVENVGNRPMTNVEVTVRLIDPDDEVIGEFYDDHADEQEVWRLDPGEAERFVVRFPDTEPSTVEEAVRYEIWATGEVGE